MGQNQDELRGEAGPIQGPSNPAEESFPQRVKEALKGAHKDPDVVLNIPVWGWTGHGKTCAILTVVHFADSCTDGLGLAFVENVDKLVEVEKNVPEYSGLNFAEAAKETRSALQPLIERFIDSGEWPGGTDKPNQYILEIHGVAGRVGYLVLPDLRGGSFRDNDRLAKAALGKAHACVAIIDSKQFTEKNPNRKRIVMQSEAYCSIVAQREYLCV